MSNLETDSARRGDTDSGVIGWMTEFLRQQSILPREDARLREAAEAGLSPVEFDQLRKAYQQPMEWTGQRVTISCGNDAVRAAAEQLGLKVASE